MRAPRTPLLLPPPPPAPVNTLMLSTAGFMLSLAVTGIMVSPYFFPGLGAYLVENLYGLMSIVPMAILALLFGVRAVSNESRRKQFQYIVWDYTRKTKDTRYIPYILPVHSRLVNSVFVLSIAMPFIGQMGAAYILGLK